MLFVVLSLLFLFFVGIAHAPWSSIGSGYAIWTDAHGVNIPVGVEVTATAGTTEYPPGRLSNKPDVTAVRFRWMPPSSSGEPDIYDPPIVEDPKPLSYDGTTDYEGWPVYTAESKLTPNIMGDWGVQAWFYNTEGNLAGQSGVEAIRAVSFNTVPEIPIVGTLGAAAAMLLSLGLYWHTKKS